MQPGKTKNQNRPLRTYRTYPPHAKLERGWAGGRSSQSQNVELSMQVREPWMDNNRASAADNLRKISLSCVSSEKFFSTVVSYEKYNFRLFHCVQPTKIIRFHWWPAIDRWFPCRSYQCGSRSATSLRLTMHAHASCAILSWVEGQYTQCCY